VEAEGTVIEKETTSKEKKRKDTDMDEMPIWNHVIPFKLMKKGGGKKV